MKNELKYEIKNIEILKNLCNNTDHYKLLKKYFIPKKWAKFG